MRKRIFSRVLALFMAVSMLSTTAFAAQVLVQDNIDKFTGTNGELLAHDNNGNRAEDDAVNKYYDYYLGSDVTLDKTLVVNNGVNASIDLNGYTLQLNDQSVVIKDEDGYTTGIKVADSSGTVKVGSVIMVTGENTKLTVTDKGIEGVERGDGIGNITGGNNSGQTVWYNRYGSGGGVYVIDGAAFEMTGGKVTGNVTTQKGGGIAAIRHTNDVSNSKWTSVKLDKVEVSDNVALVGSNRDTGAGGGGVYIDGWCVGKLINTNVVNNFSDWAGGGLYGFANAKITVNGGEISRNNAAAAGGGIRVLGMYDGWRVDLDMQNVKLDSNRVVTVGGGGAIAAAKSDITLDNVVSTNNKVVGDGGALSFDKTVALTVKGITQAYDNTIGEGKSGKDIWSEATIAVDGDHDINDILPWGYVGEETNIHDAPEEGNRWYAGWIKQDLDPGKIEYKFVSGTENKELPDDFREAKKDADTRDFPVDDGTWKFQSWTDDPFGNYTDRYGNPITDETAETTPMFDKDGNQITLVEIVGTWVFVPDTVPDPNPNPNPEPEPEPEPVPVIVPDTLPEGPVSDVPADDGTTIADEETPLAGAVGLNDTDHFAYVIGYEDDTVRPLNNITRAEAATIFFRLMTDEYRQANWSTINSFTDVNAGDWYNNAVSTCANAGVLEGYTDGTFRPNAPITRAEFASMAAGFMDESITDDGTGDFSDTANHWAASAIRRAAKAGWVTGTGNKFNPDARITRAEVMTIVNRMLDRTPDEDHMLPEMKTWTDNPKGEWYYEAVQEATNEHDYERDELNVETWTELLTVRDWAALETEWANNGGASAPKADDTAVDQRRVPDGI